MNHVIVDQSERLRRRWKALFKLYHLLIKETRIGAMLTAAERLKYQALRLKPLRSLLGLARRAPFSASLWPVEIQLEYHRQKLHVSRCSHVMQQCFWELTDRSSSLQSSHRSSDIRHTIESNDRTDSKQSISPIQTCNHFNTQGSAAGSGWLKVHVHKERGSCLALHNPSLCRPPQYPCVG